MECTIAASVFFAVTTMFIWLGAFLYKKTDYKQAGLTWVALLIIMLNCYHTFAAAILSLTHLSVNLISMGIADIAAGLFFWWHILKKKEYQKYEVSWIDLLTCVTLVVAVCTFAHYRYDGTAFNLNYLTIDPANHFRAAMDVVNTGEITSMFYETVWNGLFIELLGPFFSVDCYYKIFVLSELINLALSGLIFYGIVRKYFSDRYTKLAGYVLTLMYLVGYPMCSSIYGFVYLGMGVSVIGLLIIVTDMYLQEEMNRWLNIVFLMLGCLSIFECYVLFMPVTFFAIISCIFLKQWKRECLFSKDTVVVCLAVFLIPCIIGFIYTYMGIFTEGVTVSSAIVNEGACYRDLYSNFIPYIPLILLGYGAILKKKKNCLLLFLAPFTAVFTVVLFFKTIMGQASTYYYYKMYFMIWLIALLLVFGGVLYAEKQTRLLIAGCFAVWCFLTGIYLGKIEERIKIHNDLMVEEVKAGGYNDILAFNMETMMARSALFTAEKMELYHYVYNELLENGEELVPLAGYWEDDLWYQAITNQRYYGWGTSDSDHTDYFNHLNESNAQYLLVLTDSQIYADEQAYFDSLEKVYENAIGFVVKLN